MDIKHIRKVISQGEGLTVEFKESRNRLNRDVYETVCAFLNRHGGELLLGVKDNGDITGIDNNYIEQIKKDFITAVNNPQKLNPPFYLKIEEVKIDNRDILYIYVPESSQVHRCNGKIFDRNEDGDLDITNNTHLVSSLYIRKQTSYTENRVFPYAGIEDLRIDLLDKARIMAKNENGASHPWFSMNNEEMLRNAQLVKRDFQTGKEGLTLAAILLFGKDDTILSVLPHHKTDAILRRINLDRYDDRDDIRTNLMDSYDRLMAFVAKHISDPFYLEDDVRVSLRTKIFREAIGNILIH